MTNKPELGQPEPKYELVGDHALPTDLLIFLLGVAMQALERIAAGDAVVPRDQAKKALLLIENFVGRKP
jgi:hypothetical protein